MKNIIFFIFPLYFSSQSYTKKIRPVITTDLISLLTKTKLTTKKTNIFPFSSKYTTYIWIYYYQYYFKICIYYGYLHI